VGIGAVPNSRFEFNSNGCQLNFTRADANYLQALSSGGVFIFQTNGANERMRISSNGDVSIGNYYGNKFEFNGNGCQLNFTRADANYIQALTTGGFFIFQTNGANERMRITAGGSVCIGTNVPNPSCLLTIAGGISCSEVKVSTSPSTADFVFEKNYKLRSLAETEQYITENKHLPEIQSAADMQANGLNMAEFQIKLLQKVEELTLHLIEQQKQIDALKKENKGLRK
jgi:predicted transcriptional regulator